MIKLNCGPLVLNPGSVGCPAYDDDSGTPHVSEVGSPHARFAIADVRSDGAINIELIAVAYDHMAASRRAASNGRPEWAQGLATGLLGQG